MINAAFFDYIICIEHKKQPSSRRSRKQKTFKVQKKNRERINIRKPMASGHYFENPPGRIHGKNQNDQQKKHPAVIELD